jgi:hypothetical protein
MRREASGKPKRRRSTGNAVSLVPTPHGANESVRIRQIKNGWIITRESSKRGRYVSVDEFSPTRPSVVAAPAASKGQSRAKPKPR